ncbi:MAG: glycosyltransferase family 4 protein [Pseudomonadota bacterium]
MTINKERLSILMLGEALERPGGVVTVEKATLASAPDRLSFHHIGTLPPEGPLGPLRKFVTLLRAIIAMIVHLFLKPVDVVHIHVSMGASIPRKSLLARIAFLFGKPVVMHTHGGAFAEQFPTMPGLLQTFIRSSFRRCDAVITLAETWRRFYIETLGIEPERALILKNPVRLPDDLPEHPSASSVHLLYLGMMSKPKGAFDLIDAMAALDQADLSGLHLTMAGHGEVDEARAKVAAFGLDRTITVHGWIDAEERDRLLAQTQVFILPSHFEGLPMALLEAMSFKIAPIATPVGGIPDILKHDDNGLLVPPGDQAALAAAIKRLASDNGLRKRLGERARASVEPYSAGGYAEALVDIYRTVAADGALARA